MSYIYFFATINQAHLQMWSLLLMLFLLKLQFFGGFGHNGTSFEQTYRCYPSSFIDKVQMPFRLSFDLLLFELLLLIWYVLCFFIVDLLWGLVSFCVFLFIVFLINSLDTQFKKKKKKSLDAPIFFRTYTMSMGKSLNLYPLFEVH